MRPSMYRNGLIGFIVAIGTLASPLPVSAQQKMPVVGFLTSGKVSALNKTARMSKSNIAKLRINTTGFLPSPPIWCRPR